MAYQKDTANTLVQTIDKFLSFCCLHGGYTRKPDSGTVKSIRKGDVNFNFNTALFNTGSDWWDRGRLFRTWMSYDNGQKQQYDSMCAVWEFKEPFVAIDMFANQKQCSLIIELSDGVFTQISLGKMVDLVGNTLSGEFLTVNGSSTSNYSESGSDYRNCIDYDYGRSSFFGTPDSSVSLIAHKSRSFYRSTTDMTSTDFIATTGSASMNTYFCGHKNPLTDVLIARSPSSNILRHTSPPLYVVDYNASEKTQYVRGYIDGVRPCTMNLLAPRDIIMDRWMAFPLTSINDNTAMYPSCLGRGYLFDMGD